MSAIFDFSSLVMVLLLMICTCSYLRELRPHIFDSSASTMTGGKTSMDDNSTSLSNGRPKREGLSGFLWKLSRVGERLSPYVSVGCVLMAVHVLFLK